MISHDFEASKILGDEGEAKIINYLQSLKSTLEVIDVRDAHAYRDADIDLIWKHKKGTSNVEVKTDQFTSGNVFYETMSAVETGSEGCMIKTKADLLFYYLKNFNELYILDMKEYRDWVTEHYKIRGFKKVNLYNNRYDGSTYTSQGLLIPKTVLDVRSFLKKKVILN